jgi:multiple sugar transport system substrate-binding protein
MSFTSPRRTRRVRTALAVVAMAATVTTLAACSGGGVSGNQADSSGKTKILVWHQATADAAKQLNTMIDSYNSSQSKYEVTGQFGGTSDDFTPKLVSALTNGEAPNLVLGDGNPSKLGQAIDTGKVVPLDGLLSDSKSTITKESILPGMLSAGVYGDKTYSLPTDGGDYGLLYNKKMFAAAGIDSPPTTWAEVAADSKKLTGGGKYGIYLPIGTGEWPVFTWQTMLWSAGGEFLNADNTKVEFNSPEGVKALTAWTDILKDGNAYPQSLATSADNQGIAGFSAGKVGMVITGAYNLGQLEDAIGKDNVGVATFPSVDKPAMNTGTDVSYLLKGTSKQEAGAWDFLQWWLKPTTQAKWDISTGYLPTNVDTVKTKEYSDYLAKNPKIKVFVDQLSYAKTRPSILTYTEVSDALSTELEKALLLKESPADALKTAAANAQKALK